MKVKDFETGRLAKDRLKCLIINDRIDSTSQVIEMLKMDVMSAVSNYMEIEEDMDIQIGRIIYDNKGFEKPVLLANIPIKSVKKMA